MQSPLSQDRCRDCLTRNVSFIPVGMDATRMALQPTQPLTSKKTTDSDRSCGQNITDDHSLLPNPQ